MHLLTNPVHASPGLPFTPGPSTDHFLPPDLISCAAQYSHAGRQLNGSIRLFTEAGDTYQQWYRAEHTTLLWAKWFYCIPTTRVQFAATPVSVMTPRAFFIYKLPGWRMAFVHKVEEIITLIITKMKDNLSMCCSQGFKTCWSEFGACTCGPLVLETNTRILVERKTHQAQQNLRQRLSLKPHVHLLCLSSNSNCFNQSQQKQSAHNAALTNRN